MTFTTHIDHAQSLVIFHNHDELTQDDLDRVLMLFRCSDFPVEYDIITLFDADVHTRLDHRALVPHAVERQRTLIERGARRAVRSAFVAVPESLRATLELWPAFFPETENSLLIRFFDTLDEACDWLGRTPVTLDRPDYDSRTSPPLRSSAAR